MGRRGASDAMLNLVSAIDIDEMSYFICFLISVTSLLILVPLGILIALIFDNISFFISFSHSLAMSFFVFFVSSIRILCFEFFDKKESIAINNTTYNHNPPKSKITRMLEYKKTILYSIFAIICIIIIEISILY